MPLHPPNSRKERLLVYGRSGAGKSSTWLSVANWALDTDADTVIHLGDTDHAWDAMRYEDIEPYISVTDLDINEYPDWLTWTRTVREKVKPSDWVVVDMIDKAWTAAQTHFWYQMSGGDPLGEIYLRNQQAIVTKGEQGEYMGGAHGANWGVINKFYGAFFQAVIAMPCHVLCIAPAAEIRQDSPPAERDQWKIGWKPQGQKDLPHGFHTILFAAETPRNYIYSTVKERGPIGRPTRPLLKGEEVQDFVTTYLMKIGGWRP